MNPLGDGLLGSTHRHISLLSPLIYRQELHKHTIYFRASHLGWIFAMSNFVGFFMDTPDCTVEGGT